MSQQQISANGEEELTCLQEDFLVNLSPLQVQEKEQMITATSGRTLSEQLEKSSPLGLLVKTLAESSQWYSPARRLKWVAKPLYSQRITRKQYSQKSSSQKPSAKILNVRDIPSNRLLFRLVPSERPTAETGCSLLPTVQTQGLKVCNEDGKTEFMNLLPTPNAREADKYTKKYNPNSQMGTALTALAMNGLLPTPRANKVNGCDLNSEKLASRNKGNLEEVIAKMAVNGMLPTPTASSQQNGCSRERTDGVTRRSELNHLIAQEVGATSQLNPLFVAEMMGFPPAWTVSPFRSGDKKVSKDSETR